MTISLIENLNLSMTVCVMPLVGRCVYGVISNSLKQCFVDAIVRYYLKDYPYCVRFMVESLLGGVSSIH